MLRPIDLTLTIQGSSDAHRSGIQGTQAGRPEVASQMFADRLEKQVRQQEQQVTQAAESEKADVNPDGKGHGGYHSNRKQSKKPEPAKEQKPKPGESMYDIRI